ncbi:MAG: hypothetical protein K8R48_01065 [Alphaproteobacteria bacterium]|nr:hypothetical protein [Alphaproteobacteria bacterium]
MLSSMAGCKSPAPREEQAPERQNTEWIKTKPEAAPVDEESCGFRMTAAHPDNHPVRTQPSQPDKKKDPVLADKANDNVSGIFNRQTAVPLFFNKSFTLPLAQTSFLNRKNPVSLLQNKNPAPLSIRTDLLKLPHAHHAWDWQVRVYASHAFTHYFPSDIRIKTSRYDVKIDNYEWVERSSREFFNPKTWSKPGNNPFQVFDEPSNTYTLAFEKNAHVIFVSHFHPKFYQEPDQIRHIQGTIDGVAVDHTAPVNDALHGNYYLPGAMRLEDNKNTYLQMEFEAGYAHKFTLLDNKKFGKVLYVPGISAGVQTGRTRSAVIKDGERVEYHEQYSLQGVGGSIRNKIEWRTPKERFGLFYENKTSLYHRKHELLDGTQEFNFCYTANTVGFSFSLYNPANHHKKYGPGCK